MRYEDVKDLAPEKFRRLTGVKPAVFREMAEIIRADEDLRRMNGGPRRRILCAEDRLLTMLEYWREYRTFFHMAQSRGMSESQVNKIVRRCEDLLAKSGRFSLPGRKALTQKDAVFEVVLIDATETPIERPKKNSAGITRARRSGIR